MSICHPMDAVRTVEGIIVLIAVKESGMFVWQRYPPLITLMGAERELHIGWRWAC